MNKKEKILLLIFAIVILIIIMLTILINISKNVDTNIPYEDSEYVDKNQEGKEITVDYVNTLSNIKSSYEYYNVKYCAETYQSAVNDILENNTQENRTKIYSILSDEYIKSENISDSNIYSKYKQYRTSDIYIDEILSTALSNNVTAYLVKGKIVEEGLKQSYKLIIELDMSNNTFLVYPNDYAGKVTGDTLNITPVTEIKANDYNKYTNQSSKYKSVSQLYYEKMRTDLLYDPDYLYGMLDEEYKQKRFDSKEKFDTYVSSIRNKMVDAEITQYVRDYYDGYTEYTCIDSVNNHYIFKETSPMKYTVMLDDYTIETDYFKTQYAQASNESKAVTDADKFMKMINSKDYETAYNLLDATYKANTFPTLSSYIQSMEASFYENNFYEMKDISEQGSYYIVTIEIKDRVSASANNKTIKVIIGLKEGTNFAMSFAN